MTAERQGGTTTCIPVFETSHSSSGLTGADTRATHQLQVQGDHFYDSDR